VDERSERGEGESEAIGGQGWRREEVFGERENERETDRRERVSRGAKM